MLDKKELKQVTEVVAATISEVFKNDLFPFLQEKFDAIDRRFDRIEKRQDENDQDHDEIFRKLNQNTREHDKMFEMLDSKNKKLKDHEKRIKKLERVTSD